MINTVFTKEYRLPDIDTNEVLRYAGVKELNESIRSLIDDCKKEVGDISGKVCWAIFPVRVNSGKVELPFRTIHSKDLSKNLEGCDSVIVFGATIGLNVDRKIAKYSIVSQSRAVILQAIYAERIEALCDLFCEDMGNSYTLKPRFSPGYGDVELSLQGDLIKVLDSAKKIGLTVNKSMVLSPSKSVTAFVGVRGK